MAGLNSFRGFLYWLARLLGDVNAVEKHPAPRRAAHHRQVHGAAFRDAVGVQWELRPVLALGDERFAFALPLHARMSALSSALH